MANHPHICKTRSPLIMQTHHTICPAKGFTLLEVLVVIVIISILITLTTLAIGDRSTVEADEEINKIMTLVRLAKEEAVFQSRDFAISFWQKGYAFHELTPAGWQLMQDDGIFRERELPEDMKFTLELEGIEAVLSPVPKQEPQIFILSSMEVSMFKLELLLNNEYRRAFEVDALGKIITHIDEDN